MKYLDKHITVTEEIKAETLILQMEIKEEVCMQGVFSRNYLEDLIGVDDENGYYNKPVVKLSRDSIFHLLPEGLFFEEDRIKNMVQDDFHNQYERFKEDKKTIELFFQPLDAAYFKLSLEMEKILNNITQKGNMAFAEMESAEWKMENEYISRLKMLCPFASHLKGNLLLLTELLKDILSIKKIELKRIKPFYLRFIVHCENLSQEAYQLMDEKMIAFFTFFRHWFLPMEMEYDYRIKDYQRTFILDDTLLLDYNTQL